jgi:hypothetical protein
VSVFPTRKLTITSHTAVRNWRIDGDWQSRILGGTGSDGADFSFLGVRLFSSQTNALYRATSVLDIHAGYQSDYMLNADSPAAFTSHTRSYYAGIMPADPAVLCTGGRSPYPSEHPPRPALVHEMYSLPARLLFPHREGRLVKRQSRFR